MKQQGIQYLYAFPRSLVLALLFVLGGCGVFAPQTTQPNIPDTQYFEQHYYAAEDNAQLQSLPRYLGWVEQFYQGSALQAKGWARIVIDCVAGAPVQQQPEVEALATNVGRKIAVEWAKDNSLRKISTRHVAVWGIALREAIDRGEVLSLFEQVDADVDALIAGDLHQQVVKAERYYEPEFNEFF